MMNRIVHRFALFVLVTTGYIATMHTFPHTLIFENKTPEDKRLSVDSLTVLKTVNIQTPHAYNLLLKPEETVTLTESGEVYMSLRLNNTLRIDLKNREPIVKIELRDNNKVAIRTMRPFSYVTHATLKAAAAKTIVFEQFAQTRAGAWLSSIWQSLKAQLARIFPHSTPKPAEKPMPPAAPFAEEIVDLPEQKITIQIINATDIEMTYGIGDQINQIQWLNTMNPRSIVPPMITRKQVLVFMPSPLIVLPLDLKKFQATGDEHTADMLTIVMVNQGETLGYLPPAWQKKQPLLVSDTDKAWQLFPAANALRLYYLSIKAAPSSNEEKLISRLVLNVRAITSGKEIAQIFRTMVAPYHPDKYQYLTDAQKAELPEAIRNAASQILSDSFSTLK
jgi:hypothetical protein